MTAVVIPFRRKPEPPKPTGWMLTALIDSNANLEADDLFACYLSDPNQVMFWKWYGPTGRDTNGRFCKRADSREKIATDHIGFSMQTFGMVIFTCSARWSGSWDLRCHAIHRRPSNDQGTALSLGLSSYRHGLGMTTRLRRSYSQPMQKRSPSTWP
jgi:hypothetical protein